MFEPISNPSKDPSSIPHKATAAFGTDDVQLFVAHAQAEESEAKKKKKKDTSLVVGPWGLRFKL